LVYLEWWNIGAYSLGRVFYLSRLLSMKKIHLVVVVLVSIVSCFSSTYAAIGSIDFNLLLKRSYTDSMGNAYAIYQKPAITVLTPKEFSFHFFSEGMKLRDFVSSYSCSAWLNGTYFWQTDDHTYYPAGVRYQYGSYLRTPLQPMYDRNLQVVLSGNGKTLWLYDNNSFDFSSVAWQRNSWYVNAGPWLVRDGHINANIVNNKSHRQRPTSRVGIITNPAWDVHFLVATQPISLPQFVVFAYVSWIGTWAFQFINVDGGSSTSLHTPYNHYQDKKRLPSFICIH